MTQPNGETVLFFRNYEDDKLGEYFYPIQLSGTKPSEIEAADHAACNPGTLRIERTNGDVLWSQATQ